jgi:hypothetical protein
MASRACPWTSPNEWSEWSDWLGRWSARAQSLAAAGTHAGILFAHGRRRVTTWLQAAGISDEYQD